MATLESTFDDFLSKIEPSKKAKEYAQDAHTPIRVHLEKDEEFKEYFQSSFLYGSYRRNTAIGNIKDVDIVVLTDFDPDTVAPDVALQTLKEAIGRYYKLPDNEELQSRSVRVNDPLPDEKTEMTLDIIPAIPLGGEDDPILVPDREIQEWKQSNPKAHLRRVSELNAVEYSDGRFVPLVKMMRWWWSFQSKQRKPEEEKVRPKGFWLECLTGEVFDPSKETWAEHFVSVLEAISQRYKPNTGVPALNDPGLPGVPISTGMSQEEFNFFLEVVDETLVLAKGALAETDEAQSLLGWGEIFGDYFPIETSAGTKQEVLALGDTSHEQTPPWPRNVVYSVNITKCMVKSGFLSNREIVSGGTLTNGHGIEYHAQTNVPEPYEVYWQVVNTGPHAQSDSALRGGFDNPKNPHKPLRQAESSSYTGKHWIRCFIVKNGYLVAESNRFYINVFNVKRSGYRGPRRRR